MTWSSSIPYSCYFSYWKKQSFSIARFVSRVKSSYEFIIREHKFGTLLNASIYHSDVTSLITEGHREEVSRVSKSPPENLMPLESELEFAAETSRNLPQTL